MHFFFSYVSIKHRVSSLAQLVEHAAVNRRVVGSSPTRGASFFGVFVCLRVGYRSFSVIRSKLKKAVVVDVETPNRKNESICSIACLCIEDGVVVAERYFLINPEDRFDDCFVSLHGISPDMVRDSITFEYFWNIFGYTFENSIVIGHNVKFDLNVIFKSLVRYGFVFPEIRLVDTQRLARKYLGLTECSLERVCNYLNIDLYKHHNALYDAKACLKIFEYVNKNYGLDSRDIKKYRYIEKKFKNIDDKSFVKYSDETKYLQELNKLIKDTFYDNKFGKNEIKSLNSWIDHHSSLIGNYQFDKIRSSIKNILKYKEFTKEGYSKLVRVFNEFIDPISEIAKNKNIIFYNKVFCLTGTFNCGSKDSIEKKIINKGGICRKSVTFKTDYLIVGNSGSAYWKFANYGDKVQKAIEFKEKGVKIDVIKECDFLKQL